MRIHVARCCVSARSSPLRVCGSIPFSSFGVNKQADVMKRNEAGYSVPREVIRGSPPLGPNAK